MRDQRDSESSLLFFFFVLSEDQVDVDEIGFKPYMRLVHLMRRCEGNEKNKNKIE